MLKDLSIEVGRVVISKAGRDKGRCLMIYEVVDDDYVLLVDGTLRKIRSPKRKKIKHLDLKPECLDMIKEKIMTGQKVFDAEIKSRIESFGYGPVGPNGKEG